MTLLEFTREKELEQARKDMANYRKRINADPEKRAEYLNKKRKEWDNMSSEAKDRKNQKEKEEYEDLKHHDVEEYDKMLASVRKQQKNRNEKSKVSARNHYSPWKDRKAKKKVVGHEKRDSEIAKELGRTVFAVGDKRKELKENKMKISERLEKKLLGENEVKFDGGHGREGEIWISTGKKCDSCKQNKKCLCMDSSEGEYGAGSICKECIDKLFGEK